MPWRWLFWITLLVLAAGAVTVLALPVRLCWASGFGTGRTPGLGRSLLCALLLEGPYLLAGAAAVLSRGSRWQGVVVLVCSCCVAGWTAFSAATPLPQPHGDKDAEATIQVQISNIPPYQYPEALLALFLGAWVWPRRSGRERGGVSAAEAPQPRAAARWNILSLVLPFAGLFCGVLTLLTPWSSRGGPQGGPFGLWFGFCALGVVAAAVALARAERLRGASIAGFVLSALLVCALAREAVAWVLLNW